MSEGARESEDYGAGDRTGWLSTAAQRVWVTLAGMAAYARRTGAEYHAFDYGAVGDGVADDTKAIQDAIDAAAAAGGARVLLGSGTFKCTSDITIADAITLRGAGQRATFLQFDAGHGLRIRGASAGHTGARNFCVEHLRLEGVKTAMNEWQANHTYRLGDRVRSVLGTADGASLVNQHDAGLHFKLTGVPAYGDPVSGGSQPAWTSLPGDTVADGGLTWTVEDWSGISVETSFGVIRHVGIGPFTDCGVFMHGAVSEADPAISDGTSIEYCTISDVSGHGIYATGSDASLNHTLLNDIENVTRGAAIWDAGFFTSNHIGNQAVTVRASYIASGSENASVWIGNYQENNTVGYRLAASALWLNGTGGASVYNAGRGFDVAGVVGAYAFSDDNSPPWQRTFGGGPHEQIFRSGDVSVTNDEWLTASDAGGRLTLRFQSNDNFVARAITGARSPNGPNMWVFPLGFYMGANWWTFGTAAPTHAELGPGSARLWRKGDLVWNTNAGAAEPIYWRAQRDGGWGGGRFHSGRVWAAGGAQIGIGEGLEPSVSNGKVYRVTLFEVSNDGGSTWVTDNRLTGALPTSEPTWPTTIGQTVTGTSDSTHRVTFTCYAAKDMDWDVGPVRSDTVSTT